MATPAQNTELTFLLRSLTRVIYYVTEEEDRALFQIRETLKQHVDHVWVFNAAFGLVPLNQLIRDWSTRAHQAGEQADIHSALIQVYKNDPKDDQDYYLITDPERWLKDDHVVRRILNVIEQCHNDDRIVKTFIFIGNRAVIPTKLAPYVEVVTDPGLPPQEILATIEESCERLKITPPPDAANVFKGLASYQIKAAVAQSIVKTKKDPVNPKRIDPKYITEYRRRQLKKTDLVQQVDTDKFSFAEVGGAGRFKAWARKSKAAWTDAGQKFGLKPPKGVLLVGVWGCGKSLSVKALGSAWGLPVINLEMGRLRSSGVGESEANVYRAIRIIEASAPALIWVDEAEKSLSGGQSSAQSDAGTTSRTIGILSTWLQETQAPVCLAMTANTLDNLPIEFVNRMDERFFFDLPSEEDRIDILKIHIAKARQDPTPFNLALLSERANGMVGREIEQAIGAAMVESFSQNREGLDEDILAAALQSKPRIIKTMVDEVKKLMEWVGFDEDLQEGVRARFASEPTRGGTMKYVEGGNG